MIARQGEPVARALAGLLLTAMALLFAGGAGAQSGEENGFGLILAHLEGPGATETFTADSLTDLVAGYILDVPGFRTYRPADPYADLREAVEMSPRVYSDAGAAAVLSVRPAGSGAVVSLDYVPLDGPGAPSAGDPASADRTVLSYRRWPPSAGSDTAEAVVPILGEFVMASAYSQRGMYDMTLRRLDSVLETLEGTGLTGARARYHALRARVLYAHLDDPEAALEDLDAALRLDPELGAAYLLRADLRLSRGDLQGAHVDLTRAISRDSTNAAAWRMRGSLELASGEYEAAEADLTRAIELGLPSPGLYYDRAMAYVGLIQKVRALEDLHMAITMDSTLIDAYMHGMVLYATMGRGDAAEYLLEGGISANPDDPYLPVLLASLRGETQQLLEAADRGAAAHPDEPFFYYWRAAASDELGDYAQALEDYQQVSDFFAAGNYGRLTDPREEYVEMMVTNLRSFVGLPEESAEYYVARGEYNQRRKRYGKALEDFTHALSLPGAGPEVLYRCAICRERMGELQQAEENLERFLESDAGTQQERLAARRMLERLRR
ncbi:MAG: tetratricopeptide repeat protein [Candidatus Fermentibacteraceae bacterium]